VYRIGVQALNDDDLRRLGRMHSAAHEGLQAHSTTARAIFAGQLRPDLCAPAPDPDDWAAELHRALAFEPDHLSLYQLTIEPGTVFQRRFDQNQLPGLPAEDPAADMFDLTQRICEAAGLPAYEVSNHARPGAESRHNLIYWRGGDYAGIGPGAHGRLTRDGIRHATETERMPEAGCRQSKPGGPAKHRSPP
jgi:coproporphyrinogen III oxidase-like Fe-S oxidoreductase